MVTKQKQSGFTLIEISILTVVLWTTVAGVITSNSLIERAQLRSAVSELNGYKTAVNTYNAMPIDISNKRK